MTDKIDIIIRRDEALKRKHRKKKTPKDIGARRRQNEPLPRRLRRATGLINFYDLGQVKSGDSWIDVPFAYNEPLSVPYGGYGEIPVMPSTEWDRLTDLIFEKDPSTWKTNYRKLTYDDAHKYGLFIQDMQHGTLYGIGKAGELIDPNTNEPYTETNWTEGGWVKPENLGPTYQFVSNGLFFTFYIKPEDYFDPVPNNALVKITTSPNFSAPAVENFNLASSADIFFMPSVAAMLGNSFDGLGNGDSLVGQYRALQRSLYLDFTNKDTGLSFFSNIFQLDPPMLDAQVDAAFADAKAHARLFSSFDGSELTASDFPSYPLAQSINFQDSIIDIKLDPGAGGFIAAVLQNGQMHYIWAVNPFFAPGYRKIVARVY